MIRGPSQYVYRGIFAAIKQQQNGKVSE